MEYNNSNNHKIKIILLDIFPSIEDLHNQYNQGLSMIFHGVNIFYNLEELISQKKEIIISPNQTKKKIMISIIKTTEILATGQLQIKHGTQWVTFLYENKEKPTQGNLAHNLIDCIKINILVEIISPNDQKIRNSTIELPEMKEIKNKLIKNKKSLDNFKKIKKINNTSKSKYHNTSQEFYNSEIIEKYNINYTNEKKPSIDYSLINQTFSTITKKYNKKLNINNSNTNINNTINKNLNNNLNNSMNYLYKEFNNKKICSLKKLKSQKSTFNKKLKKRVNTSSMNISELGSKTLDNNSKKHFMSNKNIMNNKSFSKSKMNIKVENNYFSSTLNNFNSKRKNNFFFKKNICTSDSINNPTFQNYEIDIDELLSNKITEHVNMIENNVKIYDNNNKFKKIDNNSINKSKNKLIYSKSKPSNIINVNLKVNESQKIKKENKKNQNHFNFLNNNNINPNHLTFNNNSILNNNKNKNNNNNNVFELEISTNSLADETDKQKKNMSKIKNGDKTISTKKNKKIIFNQENSSEPTTISVHKNNKSQCFTTYDKSLISDKSSEQINNDHNNYNENNDSENECNNFNLIKNDFMLVYNDEYIKNIQEDLLKLEIELFIEKITELIKEYHKQIDIKTMKHEIIKNNYKYNVKKYLFQWKLNNKLKYIKEIYESKKKNIFEDKKQIDKNKINKININQKEITIFKTLFNDNKNISRNIIDINKKMILKNIIIQILGKYNNNILNVFQNDKNKIWIQQNIFNYIK